jgi:hypothetical protein
VLTYEPPLEKNAQDVKRGRRWPGNFHSTVGHPRHGRLSACSRGRAVAVYDPACGTGGFLPAAYDYIARQGARIATP